MVQYVEENNKSELLIRLKASNPGEENILLLKYLLAMLRLAVGNKDKHEGDENNLVGAVQFIEQTLPDEWIMMAGVDAIKERIANGEAFPNDTNIIGVPKAVKKRA